MRTVVYPGSFDLIIRGLRAVDDFEFEFQLALINRRMNGKVETIFMMPKDTYTFLSSRIVKEVRRLGGDGRAFVPAHVNAALHRYEVTDGARPADGAATTSRSQAPSLGIATPVPPAPPHPQPHLLP